MKPQFGLFASVLVIGLPDGKVWILSGVRGPAVLHGSGLADRTQLTNEA